MATYTSLEPKHNFHSIATPTAGIKKPEKQPAGYTVKISLTPQQIKSSR